MNSRVSRAVAAILSAQAAHAWADAGPTGEAAATQPGDLSEVIVTAQRRVENIQDVPITIQALTGDTLNKLNVQTFNQVIQYLPNVTQENNGPAQGEIFMRGLSVGGAGLQGVGTTLAFPAVAVYLDEQSGQLPGRNLDVYAVDLERIEVLEGPQGTLFGGGALSGVLRYITNKPKIDVTEGYATASYGTTAHGDPNTAITAVLNVPLVDEHLAIRGVIYNDRQGGYIDNVPSTFTRLGTDEGLARYNGGVVPTNSPVINNAFVVTNNMNPVTYQGIRASLLWKINDDWDALLTQTYQNIEADGVFYQMPFSSEGTTFDALGAPIGKYPLPPLSVTLFNDSFSKDKFSNTALVVNGKVGPIKLVYSGAYLNRNVEQVQDYTNYARGVFGYYYQCAGYSTNPADGQCYSPSTIWRENLRNTHNSQELRVSTPDHLRIRGLVGVYWEKYNIQDFTHWAYVTVPTCSPTGLNVDCFLPIQPWPGSPGGNVPNPPTGFFDDVERGYKQLAEFASIDFDIIPKVLTITAGIRHFKYDSNETGGDVGSFYCKQFTPTTYFGFCQNPYGTNFALRETQTTNTGNRGRANLTWHVTPDLMLYYTYSHGFRAGSFNRSTSCHLPDAQGINQYCIPVTTDPDNVTNNEFGWKTMWLDNHLLFNGALYEMNWDNAQTGFFDPQAGLGNLAFATNGPSYRVRGIELTTLWRMTQGLTVDVSASWNSTEQTNSPYLIANNPELLGNPLSAPSYGKPITSIANPYGPIGSPTAYSPPFKLTGRLRYDWVMGNYGLFVQGGVAHQGHMVTATGYVPAYDIPPMTTYDAAAGVAKGPWAVQLYAQNLTNVNSPTEINSFQFVLVQVPVRPRVLGIRFDYKFSQSR
ncbi:MAG: TonB-dependent receptor [Steroidobacteraceae bacterium]